MYICVYRLFHQQASTEGVHTCDEQPPPELQTDRSAGGAERDPPTHKRLLCDTPTSHGCGSTPRRRLVRKGEELFEREGGGEEGTCLILGLNLHVHVCSFSCPFCSM